MLFEVGSGYFDVKKSLVEIYKKLPCVWAGTYVFVTFRIG